MKIGEEATATPAGRSPSRLQFNLLVLFIFPPSGDLSHNAEVAD
jgi:hypothetical protein